MIKPNWAKPGCIITNTWEEYFTSGLTAVGIATNVEYKDSKGKIQECTKWVKWIYSSLGNTTQVPKTIDNKTEFIMWAMLNKNQGVYL